MTAGKTKTPRKALGRSILAPDDLPLAPAPVPTIERRPMKITFEMLALAAQKPNYSGQQIAPVDPFAPYEPMPGVLPEGRTARMAMDDCGMGGALNWAGGYGATDASLMAEGQTFLGYSRLALMAQRAEYRRVAEALSDESTRKWMRLKAKDENEDKSKKIKAIEAELERMDVRGAFRKISEQDSFFGRSHLYLDTGDTDDAQELATNLGDSFSTVSKGKISPERPLRAVRAIEAMWAYPNFYNSINPLKKDWYKPNLWFVMGQTIHASRLLTFVAREVPDILKPAYSFGGLALTQMVEPYVQNWLVTRQSVQDLLKGFSTFVLKTDMSSAYSGVGGDDFFKRADMFNLLRNNRGLMMLNKDTEDFANVSAPLSGLDHLQAQSLEHICSASAEPLVKFTGISPSGLNASSEGELRCWEDRVHSYQEAMFDAPLAKIINFIQLSLWGEIDEGITHEWLPINELTEKEQAELEQLKAQTDGMLVEMGAIDAHEVRGRIANDEASPYAGLDVDDMPEMPGAEGMMPGMEGMEGGDEPEAAIGGHGEPEEGVAAPDDPEQPAPAKPGHHPALDPNAEGWHPALKPQGEPHPALKVKKPPLTKAISVSPTGNSKSEGGFKPAKDAACACDEAKPLYVSRPLKNGAELLAWAKAQGFKTTLPASDLHVTVCYSKTPMDWEEAAKPETLKDVISPSSTASRRVKKFGEGATVLTFKSTDLASRHNAFREMGASWDHDGFIPHVTFTYDPGEVDLTKVEPYTGPLVFGPEVFAEIDDDWKEKAVARHVADESPKPKRRRKFVNDPPDGSVEARAGERL